MNIPKVRYCARCKRTLPYDNFYFYEKRRGWLSYCKECLSELARERYIKEHRDAKRCRHYSEEEIQTVINYYPTYGAKKVAAMINRSPASIYHRVQMMGIKRFF